MGRRRAPRRSSPGRDAAAGQEFEERVVDISRSAKVMRGGRRFSFSALVVVGDGNGRVGYGYGKAREVPMAIAKALKGARKALVRVPLVRETIPHPVKARFGASRVALIPAGPGTGVIAGAAVKAVAECAGIRNLLTKSFGSNNPKNLVKAVFSGFAGLRDRDQVQALRGVSLS